MYKWRWTLVCELIFLKNKTEENSSFQKQKQLQNTNWCLVLLSEMQWQHCSPVVRGCNIPVFLTAVSRLGRCEGLPPELQDCGEHDPRAFGSSADGVWHCIGTAAPAQTQLHSQVSSRTFGQQFQLSVPPSSACLPPGTISWCCLSVAHRLQHQWFCCRRWALISRAEVMLV